MNFYFFKMIYGLEFSDCRWSNKPQTHFQTLELCEDKWLPSFQLTKWNFVEGKQHLENGYLCWTKLAAVHFFLEM